MVPIGQDALKPKINFLIWHLVFVLEYYFCDTEKKDDILERIREIDPWFKKNILNFEIFVRILNLHGEIMRIETKLLQDMKLKDETKDFIM